MRSRIGSLLDRLFAIDVRSLATLRIGLAGLLLVDLAVRATDLQAHYSDSGVLPRDWLADRYAGKWIWSLHLLSGSVAFQGALFVVAALAAIAMLLGIGSRWAVLVNWLLLISLHVRNPLVNNGGDVLLRLLLFWSMFLPLDRCWALRPSVGSRGLPIASSRRVLSVASAALLVQFALVYAVSGYYKYHGAWVSADVLEQILKSDCYTRSLATRLIGHPELLAWASRATLWSELLLPWLIFLPVATAQLRVFTIAWFAALHLGIEMTLHVGLFSYTCWIAWLLFLPTGCWDWLMRTSAGGNKSAAELPETTAMQRSRMNWPAIGASLLASLLLAYVVVLNLTQLPRAWTTGILPRRWHAPADLLGLAQKWNLFQRPMQDDGWYVAAARLDDGRVIDLLRDGAPADWDSYHKPAGIAARFPNHRWRKYYRVLLSGAAAQYREPLCRYLATQWEQSKASSTKIETVELQYMQELGGHDAAEYDRFQQRFLYTLQRSAAKDATGSEPVETSDEATAGADGGGLAVP